MWYQEDYRVGNVIVSVEPYLVTEEEIIEVGRRWDPRAPMNALAWLAERFSSKSNFNRFSIYCTCVDHTFVHNKATRDFGYQPIFSTEEAFKITLDWLKTKRV